MYQKKTKGGCIQCGKRVFVQFACHNCGGGACTECVVRHDDADYCKSCNKEIGAGVGLTAKEDAKEKKKKKKKKKQAAAAPIIEQKQPVWSLQSGSVLSLVAQPQSPSALPCTLQVLEFKSIQSGRTRIVLSDGTRVAQGLLDDKLTKDLITSGKIKENVLVQINACNVTTVRGVRVVIVKRLDVYDACPARIGDPKDTEDSF